MYKEQMSLFHYGDALWEPSPTDSYARVELGDVGFIRYGRFHLLFSAGCPLGSRRLGEDVPKTFQPLNVGPTTCDTSWPPRCISINTHEEFGAGFDASVSVIPPVAPGLSISFELTQKRGATLITRDRTFREDIKLEGAFAAYTERHYDSWVDFARSKQFGNDIEPILVAGVDMTRDFAMMTYSDKGGSLSSKFTIIPAHVNVSAWGKWETQGLVHTNCGPDIVTPPPSSTALKRGPSGTGKIPKEYNQCIFLRYFTMRWRYLVIHKPMLIRAGPGGGDPGGSFDLITEHVVRNSEGKVFSMRPIDVAQILEGTSGTRIWANIELDGNGVGRLLSPSSQQLETMLPSLSDGTADRLSIISPFGTYIPQRLYLPRATSPDGTPPERITFAMADGKPFPAELALAGQCELLVDKDREAFTEQPQTINLRIEWPGYDGWGAQIRTVNYEEQPRSITHAGLVNEIAEQLQKFTEEMRSATVDPAHAEWKVGPGGIELRHIQIASLEPVSRDSWQPCLIQIGL